MGWGAYALSARWLAHEMSAAHTSLTPVYHDHTTSQDAPENLPLFDSAEHQLLHALSHFAQAPCEFFTALLLPPPSRDFLPADFLPLFSVDTEPLLHPPRYTNPLG